MVSDLHHLKAKRARSCLKARFLVTFLKLLSFHLEMKALHLRVNT